MKVICKKVSFQPTVEQGRSKSFSCKIVDACSIVSRIGARVKACKYICRHQKGGIEGCTVLRRERRRYCCGGIAGEKAYEAIYLGVRQEATSIVWMQAMKGLALALSPPSMPCLSFPHSAQRFRQRSASCMLSNDSGDCVVVN
jgi:hypothetical protein